MVIYLDEVFFVNALVNGLLLTTAVDLTGGGTRPWRLWAGAGFGGICAVLASLPALGWLGSLPGSALIFLGLCLLAFGWRGLAWKRWLWFFGVSCGFAGLVLGVCGLAGIAAFPRDGRVYYRITGRLLLLLAAAVWGGVRLLLDRFALHRGRELVRLELGLGPRRVVCTALRDNGNTLADPLTGERVPVACWQVAARLLPELGLTRAQFEDPGGLLTRLGEARPALRLRLIPYRAVGTAGGMLLAVGMDQVRQEGKAVSARLVAFSPTELSAGGSYEALLPGA